MMKKKYLFILILYFCTFFLTLSKGQANTFINIYYGISEFKDSKATASYSYHSLFGLSPDISEQGTSKIKFSDSTVFGGQYGQYLDDSYFGYALDISHFNADEDKIDISVISFSILMLLRYPSVKSNESKGRKYFFYGGIGIGYPDSDITVDFRPDVSQEVNSKGEGLFADYRLGLSYRCYKNISIFGEYRYADITLYDGLFEWLNPWKHMFSEESEDVLIELTINQFLIGLSFEF